MRARTHSGTSFTPVGTRWHEEEINKETVRQQADLLLVNLSNALAAKLDAEQAKQTEQDLLRKELSWALDYADRLDRLE